MGIRNCDFNYASVSSIKQTDWPSSNALKRVFILYPFKESDKWKKNT